MIPQKISATYIPEPRLQFYMGEHISPRRIVTLKPFSFRNLLDKEIYIKLLTDIETRELGIKLINHLIKGHSAFNEHIPPFYEIFGAKLVFDKNSDVVITTPNELLVNLENTFNSLKTIPRGIIIITFKDLPSNVYSRTKIRTLQRSTNLEQSLRTQFIRKEIIEKYTGTKGHIYLLMNIATAIYTKASGVPWKLSRSITPTKGLILGISFSRKRIKVSDKEVIYYGAIQLLDRHGEHLYTEIKMFTSTLEELSTKGYFVPYDKMKSILSASIDKYGKVPYIIIHKSSPIVDEEIKAVQEVINKYSNKDYPIFYIFAHIKSNTIYRAYDPSASDYSIRRGLMLLRSIKSNKYIQYILFTTGRLYKSMSERDKLGTPRPLEVAINTNMPDISRLPNYIGEQILALTKLDWNTTDPEIRMPITIKYSRKAAQIAPEILYSQTPDLKIADIRDLM
jgi:hypothetical protein